MGYDLKDNLPRNAHFWQVGLLDIVLSEYSDKSHNFRNFIFMTSHFSTLFQKNDLSILEKGTSHLPLPPIRTIDVDTQAREIHRDSDFHKLMS